MTLEYLLLLLLIAKYRDEIVGFVAPKYDEPDDYERDIMEALVCDAPKERAKLRIVK